MCMGFLWCVFQCLFFFTHKNELSYMEPQKENLPSSGGRYPPCAWIPGPSKSTSVDKTSVRTVTKSLKLQSRIIDIQLIEEL